MADDCVGLLDELEVEAAHLVGASQGGMIGQTVAIRHPERGPVARVDHVDGRGVRGRPAAPRGDPGAFDTAARRQGGVRRFRPRSVEGIGSPGFAADEGALRARAEASYDRGIYPDGTGRQLLAIVASGDRTEALRELDVPTTVIHGTDDILVDVSGGKATAAAIPGARLELIEGMGHDLPAQLWPRFVELITETAARARARTAG